MIHLETERRFSQDDPRNIYKASLPRRAIKIRITISVSLRNQAVQAKRKELKAVVSKVRKNILVTYDHMTRAFNNYLMLLSFPG